jgi:hypothetical protein
MCGWEKIYIFNNIYVNRNIIQIQNMQDISRLYFFIKLSSIFSCPMRVVLKTFCIYAFIFISFFIVDKTLWGKQVFFETPGLVT